MDPSTQAVPGYYLWELPGKPVSVHLNLEIVDRLLAEVMRGYGAVPKRGAEVGGVLMGTVEQGARTIVRVEDFEPVTCGYKRGPSYLLVDNEREAFDIASRDAQAVGYYRSHTREGLSLAAEDVELMDQNFPAPASIALLVKPYGTKVSVASFFIREDGVFPSAAPREFPFRRRELMGEDAPPRRPMLERVARRREPVPVADDEEWSAAPPEPASAEPPVRRRRPAWVWIPLSFVFLLLGVGLGFETGLSMGPKASSVVSDYSLGLTVTRDGDNLSVRWNRDCPAVRSAEKGVLEIQDGAYTKPVDLDTAQLRNANILFTNSTGNVRFRLIVYPQPGVTVMQEVFWRRQ